MKLLFHLGSNQALSLAELESAVAGFSLRELDRSSCLADATALPAIDALGGTIRIAEPFGSDPIDRDELPKQIAILLNDAVKEGRIEFGLSLLAGELPLQQIGMTVKSELRDLGRRVRFAWSGATQLATILVRKEGVNEILLDYHPDGWRIARTVAVQNPDAYTQRDMEKPARNLGRGMLPPKLAQILLNLTGATADMVVLDPFCGTGTVLIEGLAQGRQVRGSDNDPKAIEEAHENLAWWGRVSGVTTSPEWAMQADAQVLDVGWKVDAIATEGSLGPLAERALTAARSDEIFSSLADLYGGFLRRAQEMLPVGGRLVMTIPAFHAVGSDALFPQGLFRRALPAGFATNPLLSASLVERLGQHVLTPRGGIIVGAPDQFVRREVVRLIRM